MTRHSEMLPVVQWSTMRCHLLFNAGNFAMKRIVGEMQGAGRRFTKVGDGIDDAPRCRGYPSNRSRSPRQILGCADDEVPPPC